jgi:hypothetical protein
VISFVFISSFLLRAVNARGLPARKYRKINTSKKSAMAVLSQHGGREPKEACGSSIFD